MKFNKTMLVASAAALSLGLAACDGPTEEAIEDSAEIQESQLDSQAEVLEDAGAPEAAVEAVEIQADTVEDQGEAVADTVGEDLDGNTM